MEEIAQDIIADIEVWATVFFALAIVHTFSVKFFNNLASKARHGSISENLYHLLGEVEVVFGIWAGIFITAFCIRHGSKTGLLYLENLHFAEPIFVFIVMCIASTRPVLVVAEKMLKAISSLLPLPSQHSFYLTTLVIGPMLGSFITEPAAMTVTALVLKDSFFKSKKMSNKFKYVTLALLFVSVSIGGVLTHYAAPPVVMVASKFGWDTQYMFTHFGWRALISVFVAASLTVAFFWKELGQLPSPKTALKAHAATKESNPLWVAIVHFLFLALVVTYHKYVHFIAPLFLFFIGWHKVTEEHQSALKIRESLLVGYFLGGLIILGSLQAWWIKPVISGLDHLALFWGATGLTGITDNAALTYLGSLVPNLSEATKYALVSGAVTGGGLTVIANAPNPAGYSILNEEFGKGGINPLWLFLCAVPFTLLAGFMFLL